MRIKKFEINDFGKFHDLNTIDELDNGLVLIYGENEAGKTTIFELIKTLFYGFKPAAREKNPNVSWANNKIEFACDLEMDNGDKLEIYRRLLSSPSGKMIKDGKVEEIKNNALRQVSHISSEIYSKIFALKVEDLTEIQGEAWSEIQEKLLAGFGSEDLVSVREVMKNINDESDFLYRKSKRGNQVVRGLKTIIAELKKERNIARESDKEVRFFDSEISRMKNELEELKKEKINLRVIIKKAKEIAPVHDIINEIKKREEKYILKGTWKAMKNKNIGKYPELKENVDTLKVEIKNLGNSRKNQEDKIIHFSKGDIDVYENRVTIETFKSEYSDLKLLRSEIRTAEEELIRLRQRINDEWQNISGVELNGEICDRIEKIHIHELARLISKLTKIKRELSEKQLSHKRLKKQLEEEKPQQDYKFIKIIGAVIVLMGAIITTIGISAANIVISASGILASVFGVITFFVKPDTMIKTAPNQAETSTLVELRLEVSELIIKEKVECEELDKALKDIPVSNAAMEDYTEAFISSFKIIKAGISQMNNKQNEIIEKSDELNDLSSKLTNFLNIFEYQNTIKEEEKLFELSNKVNLIERHKVSNESLERRIEEIRDEFENKRKHLESQAKILTEVEDQLKFIGDGEVEEGFKNYESNVKIQQSIDFYEEQLSKIPNYEAIIEEINKSPILFHGHKGRGILENDSLETLPGVHPDPREGMPNTQVVINSNSDGLLLADGLEYSDYEVEKAESDIESITEKMKSLIESKKENEMRMNRLLEEKTLDEIESEILIRKEELKEANIKYDKLLLMKEIINIADEQFKEENQPDVLKNASLYLQKITGNKYSHIMVEELDGEVSSLLVKNNHLNKRIESTENNLSKGTLHQLYLSLRMSLIDHLDKDNEKLPICFDELLVNWDDSRLDNNLKLLKEISSKRQVFLFTCHEWLATKIEETLNTKRIDIGKQGD
ncbi:MAG: ATP-binding protein [Alkaliphilus sp.]